MTGTNWLDKFEGFETREYGIRVLLALGEWGVLYSEAYSLTFIFETDPYTLRRCTCNAWLYTRMYLKQDAEMQAIIAVSQSWECLLTHSTDVCSILVRLNSMLVAWHLVQWNVAYVPASVYTSHSCPAQSHHICMLIARCTRYDALDHLLREMMWANSTE